jgi:hypothetical protein
MIYSIRKKEELENLENIGIQKKNQVGEGMARASRDPIRNKPLDLIRLIL